MKGAISLLFLTTGLLVAAYVVSYFLAVSAMYSGVGSVFGLDRYTVFPMYLRAPTWLHAPSLYAPVHWLDEKYIRPAMWKAHNDKFEVKYSDLSPETTATVSGDAVTVHLGRDLTASACWTMPRANIYGETVYVVGCRTLRQQNREFVVRLPALISSQSVRVVWIDPNGSHNPVRIKK